jgi:hypothetical protein
MTMSTNAVNVIDSQTQDSGSELLITLTASYDGPYKTINLTLVMPKEFLSERNLGGVTEAAQGIFDTWLQATKELYSEDDIIELSEVEVPAFDSCHFCKEQSPANQMNNHIRKVQHLQVRD